LPANEKLKFYPAAASTPFAAPPTLFIRDIIKVMDEIDITGDERKKIYQLNAELKLKS
jgi:hypothetical protein